MIFPQECTKLRWFLYGFLSRKSLLFCLWLPLHRHPLTIVIIMMCIQHILRWRSMYPFPSMRKSVSQSLIQCQLLYPTTLRLWLPHLMIPEQIKLNPSLNFSGRNSPALPRSCYRPTTYPSSHLQGRASDHRKGCPCSRWKTLSRWNSEALPSWSDQEDWGSCSKAVPSSFHRLQTHPAEGEGWPQRLALKNLCGVEKQVFSWENSFQVPDARDFCYNCLVD